MRPEVTSRPAEAPPAKPSAEVPARAGRAGRALALEGLVVYLVFQALTLPFLPALRSARETFYDDVLLGFFGPEKHGLASRSWPTSSTPCSIRATCRSGCCPPPRRWRWS
jgi:hypothetical protein